MMRKLTIMLLFLLLCSVRLEALNCQLINANQILFGTYSSAVIQVGSPSISIYCDSGANYTIGLGPGKYGSITNRLMANGTQTLSYQLFSNASYTLNWGDATSPSTEVSGTGTGQQQTIAVYAQVPANQAFYTTSNGGNYSDNVTVTLTCSNCSVISGSPGNLGINLNGVAPGCGIIANNLNFGNYTGAEVDATTTLQVGCSSGTAYNVGLNAGTATGATVSNRSMTLAGGTALLNYKLLQGSYNGSNWGNTVKTDTAAGTANGAIQSLTVYGVIPAGQSVTHGTYTDTITATITY